jgi:molecular chaperone GrpE
MARKKDTEQKSPATEKGAESDESTMKENTEGNSEVKEDMEIPKEATEVKQKQLEGTEPGKLEYYSKEYLVEKVGKLEAEVKTHQTNLKKIKDEAESWKNKYMRLQAEFENAQKRWDKNRQNLRLEYTASVLKSFLPLYDSFKKALTDDKENMKVLKGFYDQFMNILKGHKAEPMDVKIDDPFDYSSQEALTSLEKADVPNNTILEIIQDGWKFDKDVLRYAKVVISREPKPPEPEPEPEPESIAKSDKIEADSKQTKDTFEEQDKESPNSNEPNDNTKVA